MLPGDSCLRNDARPHAACDALFGCGERLRQACARGTGADSLWLDGRPKWELQKPQVGEDFLPGYVGQVFVGSRHTMHGVAPRRSWGGVVHVMLQEPNR